jgi:hypothetical protein
MKVDVDTFDLAPAPGLGGLMESSPQKHCVSEEDGYDIDTMTIEKMESQARSSRGRKGAVRGWCFQLDSTVSMR